MRLPGLRHAFRQRLRQPGRALAVLALGAVWAGARLVVGAPYGRLGYGEALLPFCLLLGCCVLAPVAWQWSGDDEPLASGGRGLAQSLVWNSLWVAGLLGATRLLGVGQEPPRAPASPREGPPPFEGRPPHPPFDPDRPPPPRPGAPPHPPAPAVPPEYFHFGLGLLVATFVGRSLAEREAGEFREAALRHQTEQARALALQSQMQPHALFNALSGLVELAHDDPEATEAALVALCDYLRRVMAHATLETAPLRGERELLEDYLRIEQIRLGERLRVAWDWPAWVDGIEAPPFLLQPLVENAVLHGIAAAPEGGELRIAVHRTADQLVLKVENTGFAPGGGREGLGLGHLRERLRLWGRGRAALELVREGDWTRARLTLPLPD